MNVLAVCADYLDSCDRERHLAPHTLAAYRQDLAEFCRFFNGRAIDAITGDELVSYAQHLAEERNLAPATVKRRLACIRAMFSRLLRRGRVPANPFASVELRIRLPTRLPRCLGAGEVRAMLRAAEMACSTTRLATLLLLATGLRVSELTAIRLGDIDIEQRAIRIFGKGSRERQVFLADNGMTDMLQRYIAAKHPSGRPADKLFVNTLGLPAISSCIRRRIKTLANLGGLARKVTPHMLRHTAATALIEAGVDIRIVQRLLGHQTIATTQIYTHVSDRALREAIFNANVVGRVVTR